MPSTKRRASSFSADYYYARSHCGEESSSTKRRRRRQREKLLQTFQTALAKEAGRPFAPVLPSRRRGRASSLVSGSESVDDAEGARVMTSSEYDRDCEAEAAATTASADEDETPRDYGYGDASSMYTIAGLVRSTSDYYSFPECHIKTSSPTPTDETNITQIMCGNYGDDGYGNEKAPSEDNSEGLSSWTTSRSCNDPNDNEGKRIDDDNRSDGQSSDDAGGNGSSSSDSILTFDPPSLRKGEKKEDEMLLDSLDVIVGTTTVDGAFLVIG